MRFLLTRLDHRRYPITATVCALGGLVLGVAAGLALRLWPVPGLLAAAGAIDPLGTLWLNAVQMIIVPLAVSRLVVAIVGIEDSSKLSSLGGLTVTFSLLAIVVLTSFAATFSTALVGRFPADEAARAAWKGTANVAGVGTAAAATGTPLLGDWLADLVPTNLFRAASENRLPPIIVGTLMLALAMRAISPVHRGLLLNLFRAASELMITLAMYLFRFFPFAVFALTLKAAANLGWGIVSGMVYYVVAFCGVMSLTYLLLYPLTSWSTGISIWRFASGIWPAQAVALTTRSSTAALPSMLECARKRLGMPHDVVGLVLPLASLLFMSSRVVGRTLELILLAHLYGVRLSVITLVSFSLMMLATSFGKQGLPNGGAVSVSSSLAFFVAAGIPVQGALLVSAIEVVPDIFKTLGNVTNGMSITAMAARFAGGAQDELDEAIQGEEVLAPSEAAPLVV